MKLTSLPLLALLSTAALGCEIHLSYDDTPPEQPTIVWADADGRTRARVGIETPYDLGGVDAFSVDILDAPDGAITTSVIARASAPTGAIQELSVDGLRPGVPAYLSISALDELGNRSEASVVGPIVTDFDYSGAIFPLVADDGDNALGYQLARGDFDGDGYADLAVAAPFKAVGELAGAGAVNIYWGSPSGVEASAMSVVEGDEAYAQLGNALAVLDWNGDGVDDLALGAPFSEGADGAVYIVDGASLKGEPVVLATIASDGQGWLDGAAIGFSLATVDLDGDSRRDLVIGAVAAAQSGVLVVFGSDAGASGELVLSDLAPDLGGTSVALLLSPRPLELFGISMADVGAMPRARGTGLAVAGFQDSSVIIYRGTDRTPAGVITDVEWSANRDLEIVADLPAEAYFGAALGSLDVGGERELVVGAYRANNGDGLVGLVDMSSYGTVSFESSASAIIHGEEGSQLGTAIANNAVAERGDIDGDGLEDLVIVGGAGNVELFVWYGDEPPSGEESVENAHHSLVAPTGMQGEQPTIGGTPATAAWIGDTDGDGLDDLAWADWTGNARDGLFEILR